MRAGELIALADELRPNAYSRALKLRWLRRLDGQILAELELTHEGDPAGGPFVNGPCGADPGSPAGAATCRPQTAPAELPADYADDTELLAPFPWGEAVYTAWLFCQIDLHNGEIQKYNQSLALLASAWRSLADWLNRSRRPRGVPCWRA